MKPPDQNGQIVLIECSIYDNPMVVISVYFPTKDKPKEQLLLLDYLRGLLINYGDQDIVIGGDFSTCLNMTLDKKEGGGGCWLIMNLSLQKV